jgi:hypothetical protein
MTEQQLIAKIKTLKSVKPRENWVVLAKSEIFEARRSSGISINQSSYATRFLNIFSGLNSTHRLVYSFAVFLFIFIGVFSVVKFIPESIKSGQQTMSLAVSQTALKTNVEDFKVKSQTYAQTLKTKPQNAAIALKEVKEAAKNLTDTIEKNPELAKTIALDISNNRSYLDVVGDLKDEEKVDLKKTSNELYKVVVDPLIEEGRKTTFSPDQKKAFQTAENYYQEGDFQAALQGILLINASINNKLQP